MLRQGTIRASGFPGCVTGGTVYDYRVKVNDRKHDHGIEGGRIVKLLVTLDDKPVSFYDEGWEIRPKGETARKVTDILIHDFNEKQLF